MDPDPEPYHALLKTSFPEVNFKTLKYASSEGFESCLNFKQNKSFRKPSPVNDSVGITGLDSVFI